MARSASNYHSLARQLPKSSTLRRSLSRRRSLPLALLLRPRICGTSAIVLALLAAQSIGAQSARAPVIATRIDAGTFPPTSSHATTKVPRTALATLTGLVNDSLHLIPLTDARIRVLRHNLLVNGALQTVRTAETDFSGQFRIDSLPPGVYNVEVTHPLLDSLGLHLVAQSVGLRGGVSSSLLFQVPSANGLLKQYCADTSFLGVFHALLVGRVMDTDTDSGIAGARVQLSWQTVEVSTTGPTAIRAVPHSTTVVSGYQGIYAICGLPESLSGRVAATYHERSTPSMPVAFGADAVAIYQLSIGLRNGAGGFAILGGRVVDGHGSPVVGARAQLTGSTDAVYTDTTGGFVLGHLPSGTQLLSVQKSGFPRVQVPVTLSTRTDANVTVTMDSAVTRLAPVDVRALRARSAFEYRQRVGQGYYVDSAAIERRHAIDFTQLIETIPRLTFGGSPRSTINANTCPLGVRLLVDGIVIHVDSERDINTILPVADVAAVEVYGVATVPPEFAMFMQPCGHIVVVWTKASKSH